MGWTEDLDHEMEEDNRPSRSGLDKGTNRYNLESWSLMTISLRKEIQPTHFATVAIVSSSFSALDSSRISR